MLPSRFLFEVAARGREGAVPVASDRTMQVKMCEAEKSVEIIWVDTGLKGAMWKFSRSTLVGFREGCIEKRCFCPLGCREQVLS